MIKLKLHNLHNSQKGISFIEILILLLLISLFATFIIPGFITKQSNKVKKEFVAEFITLMNNSLYQAITTRKLCQIYFDLNNKIIMTKMYDSSIEASNEHQKFRPLYPENSSLKITIPEHLTIKNFFIDDNEDECANGRKLDVVLFYIMPDGTSQQIIINFEYDDLRSQNIQQFALSVNPFYSQVHEYDIFQHP